MDPEGYRAGLQQYYPQGRAVFRISEDVGVMLVPCEVGGRLTLKECAAVCLRVQYHGEQQRSHLTWGCSCQDFHLFRDHCNRPEVHSYRDYPNFPQCPHEVVVM